MKTNKVFGIILTFISGFIAAEVVCYHIPPIIEVPSFYFAALACLAAGVLFIFGKRIFF